MNNATVIFGPGVDAAILDLIDYVDVSDIPAVLSFLEDLQVRLVQTLSAYPEGGVVFQGQTRMFAIRGYTFLYEYKFSPNLNEVHILDMIAPGRNWR